MSDGERHDQWHRIRRGDVDVVIGTRSAVFAPLANPGLIIVDEEHDTSYKQDETPRYHGRDVAIMRGKFANALVVIGSATPTIESYANALDGRYTLVTMEKRVLERPLARVSVVNMREEIAEAGEEVVLSRPLVAAMQERLDRGEQSLILLNRRGFATAVVCRQCTATLECPNCSISLTVPSRRDGGWTRSMPLLQLPKPVPKTCEKCAAPYMERVGFGTERVEAEIRKLFPGGADRPRRSRHRAPQGQSRRDAREGRRARGRHPDRHADDREGPRLSDLHAGRRDFRGRRVSGSPIFDRARAHVSVAHAGRGPGRRGERPGEAIIQSLLPQHYSIRLACAQDYRAFYDKEVEFRRAMRYPPQVAMVNVVVRGKTFGDAMDAARDLADAARGAKGFAILGPAPAPLTKLRGEHRAQFFLKGTSRKAMREAMQLAVSRKPALPNGSRSTSIRCRCFRR